MNHSRIAAPLAVIPLLVVFACPALGQARAKSLSVTLVETPPKIDGRLDDGCWLSRQPVSEFVQYDPANGVPASEQTQVWAAYDRDHIYFAFLLRDSQPDRIWAELTPRNGYWLNDAVTVILDTYNDQRTSIEFTVNARGVQSNSVETIWVSEAEMRPDGWSAEIAIPFKSLRFSTADQHTWGVNFTRYIPRLNERDYWTTVERDKPLLMQMGALEGLENIKPGRNFEVFPYAGARASRWAGEKDDKMAAGIDVKYGILSNLVLDVTASPDFSEVESDPFLYQLSPYENYLREMRPFFTEGSRYFMTSVEGGHGPGFGGGLSLFYSRRISDPRFAAKVTGKAGGFSFGLLGAGNRNESGGTDPIAAFRVQKDVFGDSQIGAYFTSLDSDDVENRNVAADYRFRYRDIYSLRGMHALTFNDGVSGQNAIHMIRVDRSVDDGWSAGLSFDRVEEHVAPGTGYVSRTDFQSTNARAGYGWRFENQRLKHLSLNGEGSFTKDTHGVDRGQSVGVSTWLSLLPEVEVSFSASGGRSTYQVYGEDGSLTWTDEYLDTTDVWTGLFWMRGGWLKNIHLSASWEKGGVYVDDFSRVEPGRNARAEASVTFRPRSDFEVEVGTEYVQQKVDRTGDTVFSGTTYEGGLHYQITRSLFLSGRLQGETRDDQYSVDMVAGYYFGAGNIFQIAFKKGSRLEDAVRQQGYSVTAKVSYLFRL